MKEKLDINLSAVESNRKPSVFNLKNRESIGTNLEHSQMGSIKADSIQSETDLTPFQQKLRRPIHLESRREKENASKTKGIKSPKVISEVETARDEKTERDEQAANSSLMHNSEV